MLTFGQMTDLILQETFTDASVPAYYQGVQNAIVTAIKELETNQMFFNSKDTFILVAPYQETIPLPEDFINALQLTLIAPQNQGNGVIPPPPPYPPNYGFTIFTAARGFNECTMQDLKTYRYYVPTVGFPERWAIWGNNLEIYPQSTIYWYLHLYYYFRDGSYPTVPFSDAALSSTSIWMNDFTQDVTRYRARAIFYRDVLQTLDLAESDMLRSYDALERLKSRTSDRSTTNFMSY